MVTNLREFKFVGFDVEAAEEIPEGQDVDIFRQDIGISIIASRTSDGVRQLWYSRDSTGLPARRMTALDLMNFLRYLESMYIHGYPGLTWNGQGFDYPLIGKEITDSLGDKEHKLATWRRIRVLSEGHYDPMFQVWWKRGYPVGLDAVGKAMGLGGKLSQAQGVDVDGASAPHLWQKGLYGVVMAYVSTDVDLTVQIAEAALNRKMPGVLWRSRSGTTNFCRFSGGLLTVEEVMDDPGPRRPLVDPGKCVAWMQRFAPPNLTREEEKWLEVFKT